MNNVSTHNNNINNNSNNHYQSINKFQKVSHSISNDNENKSEYFYNRNNNVNSNIKKEKIVLMNESTEAALRQQFYKQFSTETGKSMKSKEESKLNEKKVELEKKDIKSNEETQKDEESYVSIEEKEDNFMIEAHDKSSKSYRRSKGKGNNNSNYEKSEIQVTEDNNQLNLKENE